MLLLVRSLLLHAWLVAPLALLPAVPALAEPVDLRDPRPRWVAVSIERSAQLQQHGQSADYSPWLPAWLAPEGSGAKHLRIRVAGAVVERHLFEAQDPRPGSFSDYALLLDADTGHVVEASYAGVVSRRLRVGPLRLSREVELRASMSTLARAGYEEPRALLGEVVFGHCQEERAGCTLVAPAPYDPRTGRLHAVGLLEGRSGAIRARLYSPLGEVVLRELEPEEAGPSFAAFP